MAKDLVLGLGGMHQALRILALLCQCASAVFVPTCKMYFFCLEMPWSLQTLADLGGL